MTVLRLLSSQRFPDFLTKYDSRSEIITKLTIKATNHYPVRYNFVSMLLIFTFTSEFQALEVIKMITRKSAAENQGGTCKARKNVKTVLAEF